MTDPDRELLAEMLLQWEELWEHGQDTPAAELAKDHPRLVDELARRIGVLKTAAWLDTPLEDDPFEDDEYILSPPTSPHLSKTFAGRYRLDALIAEGGFAQVFRAFDTELERKVAVKVPKPSRLESNDAFQAEARRVARLAHEGIVPVFDVGLDGDTCFIVTEYIEGGSLADRLNDGTITPGEVIRWATDIGAALDYAHLHGIVHLDIKPANLLLDDRGRARLADFGIARAPDEDDGFFASLGTLRYMSPEQVEGLPADHRSDIYSLAVVIHEALSGDLPLSPYAPNLRKAITAGSICLAPTLSVEVQRVLSKALSKSPGQRHASATEFATELRRASESAPSNSYRRWLAGVLLIACSVGATPTVNRWFSGTLHPGRQPTGQLLVSGIGDQKSLKGTMPSAWIKKGVFAEIKGPGVAKFPRLPVSAFVLEVDLEMRNPSGRISFYTGEPGAGVDLPFGGLWPQDSGQSKIPCRLFRSQPWGVNWIGETHFPANERMTLKLVVNDDLKAVVRNGALALGSSGDASDLCLTLTSTEDTDATIYRATCRRLTREDAEEANQHFTPHALDCDVDATRKRLAVQIDPSWNRHPEAGRPFVIDDVEMPLCWIEAGEFTMGTPHEHLPQLGAGRERVSISQGYWIGTHEVTQGQWQRLMKSNPSRITGSPFLPVNNVSWSDARAFCETLTQQERRAGRCPPGYEYRLPTEAEWEYACRCGGDEPFVIPKDEIAMRGNRHRSIVEVGTTPPNRWGLHEVLGNVPEWCLDAWRDYRGDESPIVIDRYHEGDPATSPFVIRGNGFWHTEMGSTSFSRTRRHDIRGGFRGFRVVLAPPAHSLRKGSAGS